MIHLKPELNRIEPSVFDDEVLLLDFENSNKAEIKLVLIKNFWEFDVDLKGFCFQRNFLILLFNFKFLNVLTSNIKFDIEYLLLFGIELDIYINCFTRGKSARLSAYNELFGKTFLREF